MRNTDVLTTHEAAQLLQKTQRTVQRMAQSGDLNPIFKAPGSTGAYLFDRADIEALAPQESNA
jgi:excisionase family DNA binding protein